MGTKKRNSGSKCAAPGCCCGGPDRREFLTIMGLSAAAALTSGVPVMAGPFEAADFEKLVPADKKLSLEWVKSLFARGTRTIYRGTELEKIGMPIGGICAGQLYLGGDGRLWHWDILNEIKKTGPEHYAKPMTPRSPLSQEFALRIKAGRGGGAYALDGTGFSDIEFCGEYPMAFVEYRDKKAPVEVSLEAFSPFIPLNPDDSGLPATIMRFTVKNVSDDRLECDVIGWLSNVVGSFSMPRGMRRRSNRIVRGDNMILVECRAESTTGGKSGRPDIVFEDFEKPTYEGWTVTGTAFGNGPVEKAKMPAYQGDVGSRGKRLVNSHNTRQGEDVRKGDAHTGTLTSKPFTIERDFINFLIGGGAHQGKTCINLLVEDKLVDTATGKNDNKMDPRFFDVRHLAGKTARLQIVDDEKGAWGNVSSDQIVFSDQPPVAAERFPDFGTMALALLGSDENDLATEVVPDFNLPLGLGLLPDRGHFLYEKWDEAAGILWPLRGLLGRKLILEPRQDKTAVFIVCWHFPNFELKGLKGEAGRRYANRFDSATAVAEYVAKNFDRLRDQTRLWHDT